MKRHKLPPLNRRGLLQAVDAITNHHAEHHGGQQRDEQAAIDQAQRRETRKGRGAGRNVVQNGGLQS